MINMLRWVIIGVLTFSLVKAQEIQGTPGVDYPNFVTIPNSSFVCSDKEFIPGFYADLDSQCQVYHYCFEEGQETFLCPIGSIFNQAKLACDAWYNSNCTISSQLYSSNSGPLLESAIKSVSMRIKLRNRAKNRFSIRVPDADVHEKITSLYDDSEHDQPITEDFSVSNNVSAGNNQDTSEEAQGEMLNGDESLEDILSRLEESIQNDEPADGMYEDNVKQDGASDNMQTNLFFDPVTEQYYVDPEASQNEWSHNFDDDQYGYYDRENFAYKYGLAMKDAAESEYVESINEPFDLNEMNSEENAEDKFLRRQMILEQPFRRLRRKPIYTVIQDEDKLSMDMGDAVIDSEDYVSTESISIVTDGSHPSSETETEWRANTKASFEMVEDLSQVHMTPLNNKEPLSSEEFENLIISELIVPKIDEHDLRILGSTSDQEQPSEDFIDSSSVVQNDDYYRHVRNQSPEQPGYSNVYDANSDFENLEPDSAASDQIVDTAEYYQDEEMVDDESEKSDDSFVVIPDESEIPEFSEVFGESESSEESEFQDLSYQNVDEDASARDLPTFNIPTDYRPQSVYSAADPSQYPTLYSQSTEYGPGQYFQQGYFNSESGESSSPYVYMDESYVADDSQAMGLEHNQYGVEAHDPTNPYMYASQASYDCQVGYSNCISSSESEYPYDGYYHNPYVSNFPYEVSDTEESSESLVSDEASYYTESPMSYISQGDPNMNIEQFEINQDYKHSNSYQDKEFASDYPDSEVDSENSATVLENENVEPETYYVLEDDQTTSEIIPELISEPSSPDNSESASEVSVNQGETYYVLDDEDEEKMEDGSEVENFADESKNEEVHEQQNSSHKPLNLEEFSLGDATSGVSSQPIDSKDILQSEGHSLGNDGESVFGSTMEPKFTNVPNGWSSTNKNDRNGDALLDSSERLDQNEEISKAFVSSSGNLPNMFLNNMAFSDPTNFGPHGFGSNFGPPTIGIAPTAFSSANGRKRAGDSASPNVSKLSALQERIRSLKQGKFGAFKKYVSSSGSKM